MMAMATLSSQGLLALYVSFILSVFRVGGEVEFAMCFLRVVYQ